MLLCQISDTLALDEPCLADYVSNQLCLDLANSTRH